MIRNARVNGTGRYAFTAEEKTEIEATFETAEGQVQRRLAVLHLYAKGKSYADIMQVTGYSEASILRFLQMYEKDGLTSLCSEPYSGRHKRTANHYELSLEQIDALRESYENTTKTHIARRFQALLLRSEGKTLSEVAEATGYSKTRIAQLMKKYREGGAAAIAGKTRTHIAIKHIFTPEQKTEITEARKVVTDKRITKRLDALLLRTEGKTIEQIGSKVGFHPMTVMSLIQKYQESGIKSIITSKHGVHGGSNRRYLSYDEESTTLEPFRIKVENGGGVTTTEIKTALETKICHSITETYVKQVMRRHHWTIGWMPPGKGSQDFGDRAE